MEYTYRIVNIYIDEADNLYFIPTGQCEKWGGTMDIDIVIQLSSPYSDEELFGELMRSMELCYSQKPDENSKYSPIEKFLKIKGFSNAVRNKKWVGFEWDSKKGYSIIPSQKIPRKGYVFLKKNIFNLGNEPRQEEIAQAVREAIKLSTY